MNCTIIEANVHVPTIGDWSMWPGGAAIIIGVIAFIVGGAWFTSFGIPMIMNRPPR